MKRYSRAAKGCCRVNKKFFFTVALRPFPLIWFATNAKGCWALISGRIKNRKSLMRRYGGGRVLAGDGVEFRAIPSHADENDFYFFLTRSLNRKQSYHKHLMQISRCHRSNLNGFEQKPRCLSSIADLHLKLGVACFASIHRTASKRESYRDRLKLADRSIGGQEDAKRHFKSHNI